ncbi:MAG: hypothetical protein HY438_01860 [DPANN group archaeon]|nr:hypothetical protein [DPANN group archaeon]
MTNSSEIENRLYILEWPYTDAFHGAARYYFVGPARATQKEFEGLCGRLALEAATKLAAEVRAKNREGYCTEQEKMLPRFIGLLEQRGYRSFAPKGISFVDRQINPDLPHWQYEKFNEELEKQQITIIKNHESLDWSIRFFLENMVKGERPWYSDKNGKRAGEEDEFP